MIFEKILKGYQKFRNKYVLNDQSVMQQLARYGQKPEIMVIGCCDARVDPALILQCDPGDLFVVRNVANIVPPYQKNNIHDATSAALEFGIRFLKVGQLILLGHSQCGGIKALVGRCESSTLISKWVSIVEEAVGDVAHVNIDHYAKHALTISHKNCLTFPWISEQVVQKKLTIHLWFFDIESGSIFAYSDKDKRYSPLFHAEMPKNE